jgi:hypothetical protein
MQILAGLTSLGTLAFDTSRSNLSLSHGIMIGIPDYYRKRLSRDGKTTEERSNVVQSIAVTRKMIS